MIKAKYRAGFGWLLGIGLLCTLFMAYEYGLFMSKDQNLSDKVNTELGYELIRARIEAVYSGRSSMMGDSRIKYISRKNNGSEHDFLIEDAPTAPSYKMYREGYRFTIKTQPGARLDPAKVIASLRQVLSRARARR